MEYRIKATSADHRKSIIGALKGLGFDLGIFANKILKGDEDAGQPMMIYAENVENTAGTCSADKPTHTSLDTLIADIIRDRQPVDVNVGENVARIKDGKILFADSVDFLPFEHFDRIAEAVKKVRGK